MLRKYPSFALAGFVFYSLILLSLPISAQSTPELLVQKVKAEVAKLGVGTRVSIKLRDKKKITGHIDQIREEDFVVERSKGGTQQTIAYSDVTQIKQKKEGFPTAGKVLIVLGVLWVVGFITNGVGN
jgi:hypothetical protein